MERECPVNGWLQRLKYELQASLRKVGGFLSDGDVLGSLFKGDSGATVPTSVIPSYLTSLLPSNNNWFAEEEEEEKKKRIAPLVSSFCNRYSPSSSFLSFFFFISFFSILNRVDRIEQNKSTEADQMSKSASV